MEKKTTSAKNTEWKSCFYEAAGSGALRPDHIAGRAVFSGGDVRRVSRGGPENPNEIQILTKNQNMRRIEGSMLDALASPLEFAD